MSSIYHTLAIFPTDRCNARCDICAIECGPEKKNHLPRELAEAAIRQAGGNGEHETPHHQRRRALAPSG